MKRCACGGKVLAKGLCSRCYQREWARTQRPEQTAAQRERKNTRARERHTQRKADPVYSSRKRTHARLHGRKVRATPEGKARQRAADLKHRKAPGYAAKHLAAVRRRNGFTPELVAALRKSQAQRCALCDRPIQGKNEHADHCHATGKPRGLLCSRCNTALGVYEKRVRPWLARWEAYLVRGRA